MGKVELELVVPPMVVMKLPAVYVLVATFPFVKVLAPLPFRTMALLTVPGPVAFYEASMTLPELRLRWEWDPLRGNPRFEKLLAQPAPKTGY